MKTLSRNGTRARTLSRQRVRVKKRPSMAPVMAVVLMLIVVSLFYVWSRIELLKKNYAMTQLKEDMHRELVINEELRGRVAQLKSPERIAVIAEQRLGLAFPEPSQVWPLGIKKTEYESSLKVARP